MKVVQITQEAIIFDNGWKLLSEHEQDCCEHHYLNFSDLELEDFTGEEFSKSSFENHKFFRKVPGYGIRLISELGREFPIPGYGYNNGYYSSELQLVVQDEKDNQIISIDITECQVIEE